MTASWEMYRTPTGRPTFPGIGVIGVESWPKTRKIAAHGLVRQNRVVTAIDHQNRDGHAGRKTVDQRSGFRRYFVHS
jgi:hypothetical protein